MQAFKVSCNDEMRLVPLKKDSSLSLALLVHNVAIKFQRHPSMFRLASPDLAYEPVPLEAEPAFEALMASLGNSGKPIRLTMIIMPPPPPLPQFHFPPQLQVPPGSHPPGGHHPGHYPPNSPQNGPPNGPPSHGGSAPAPVMPPVSPSPPPTVAQPQPHPHPQPQPQIQAQHQSPNDVPLRHQLPDHAPRSNNPLPNPTASPVPTPRVAAPLPRGSASQHQQQRQQQQQSHSPPQQPPPPPRQQQHCDDDGSSSSAGSEEDGEELHPSSLANPSASLELVHPSAGESWTLIQEPVQEEEDDDDDTSSSDDDHRSTTTLISPTSVTLPTPTPAPAVAADAAVDVAAAVAAARAEAYEAALLETEAKLRREMAAAAAGAASAQAVSREREEGKSKEMEREEESAASETAATIASSAEAARQDNETNESNANESEEVAEREALKKAIARAREERQQREAIERQELAARQAQEEALAAQQAQARAADASAARAKKEAEERDAAVQRSRADAQAAVGRWVRRLSAPGLAVALVGCVPEAFNLACDDAAAAAAAAAASGHSAGTTSDGAGSAAANGGSSASSKSSSASSSSSASDSSGYPPAPVGNFESCPVDFRVDRPLVEALKGLFGALTPHQIFEQQQMLRLQQQQQQDQQQRLSLLQLQQQLQHDAGQQLPQQQQARSSADLLALCRRGLLPQLGAGGLSIRALATFFSNLSCAQTPSPYPLVLGSDSDAPASGSGSNNGNGVASTSAAAMPPHLKPLLEALSSKMVRFRCVAVAAELFARVLVAALWEEVSLDATLLDWDSNGLDDPSVTGMDSDDDDEDEGEGELRAASNSNSSSGSGSSKSFLLSGVGRGESFVGLSSAGRSRLLTAMSLQSMSLEEVVSAVESLDASEKEDNESAAQALHDAKVAAWAYANGDELGNELDQDHDELALAHRHQEDPAAPSLLCSGSEAMEVLKLLGSRKRDAYCASQSLPLLLGGSSTSNGSSNGHRGAGASATASGAGNERIKLKPFLEYAGLAHLERALVRACGGATGALSGHHTAFGSSSSSSSDAQQQQLTVGTLRFLLPSEDLSGRGGLAPADVSALFRSLAVASGWGWRLAQHRADAQHERAQRKAARAARRAAKSGNLATPDSYLPSPTLLSPPHLLNGAAHPAWAEAVVRSPRFAERCVRLLLGAAGAAATQRERYDQSTTSNGSAPGPMDLPVTFGLPWAGGGALRSDA